MVSRPTLLLMAMAATRAAALKVLVTGATDGIGRHTCRKLARDGHDLLVHGRSVARGEALAEELRDLGAASVTYFNADLSDVDEVVSLGEEVCDSLGSAALDVLVNNAGVFDPETQRTKQDLETTWAVNVVAPFVLTKLLLPPLLRAAAPRVVTTSSISQSYKLNLEGLREQHGFGAHETYSRSKLGDHIFCKGLARRCDRAFGAGRVRSVCMDPGTVNTKMLLAGWGRCGIDIRDANNTYELAVTDAGIDGENGRYYFGGGGSQAYP